jgi:hypothetical protein
MSIQRTGRRLRVSVDFVVEDTGDAGTSMNNVRNSEAEERLRDIINYFLDSAGGDMIGDFSILTFQVGDAEEVVP